MSEKVKAIRGDKERAEEVKQWLKEHGAKELFDSKGIAEDFLYFVTPDGFVNTMAVKTSYYLFDIEELPHWRAKFDEEYWYIDDALDVRCTTEGYSRKHDDRYAAHNYFKTEGEAEEYCDKIIDLLNKRK